eukprot:Gregarina_sp_Poly_1__9765@NODE_622_length_7094_cov_92_849580_g477_i0_p2_GENE_NODE_622_length_7094_cov_92_849580_g477_i0NODE_622_length_7094_cov_92_849580_g477_i0_p2_ORF_typecomplete_len406_score43_87Mce4_CUP1/PF11887_8/37Mce4_CUP1/PF11887_8/0_42_NODE_622_length_7094_cov_92_849580_g477_i044075624
MLPAAERFMDLLRDVIPIYNDLLPLTTASAYRTLAALLELSPRRLNTVTLIPALLELMTVATSLSNTLEVSFPVGTVVLDELEGFLGNATVYLPHFNTYLGEVIIFLPIVAELDPLYKPTVHSAVEVLQAFQNMLPHFLVFLEVYNNASPNLRRFFQLVAGMSTDVSYSLDATLNRLSREGSEFLDFYEEPDDFVPLLASNVISILRRSGLPARLPSLRHYVPEVSQLIIASRTLLENTTPHVLELSEALVPLAASLPRTPGVMEMASDLFVQLAVVSSQFNATLAPTAVSFLKSAAPFLNALDAPVVNIIVLLPMLVSLASEGVTAIPKMSAALPAVSPLLQKTQRLLDTTRPATSTFRSFMVAFRELPSSTFDSMSSAIWQCISVLPILFSPLQSPDSPDAAA